MQNAATRHESRKSFRRLRVEFQATAIKKLTRGSEALAASVTSPVGRHAAPLLFEFNEGISCNEERNDGREKRFSVADDVVVIRSTAVQSTRT